eukprot:Rmarinus@m.17411
MKPKLPVHATSAPQLVDKKRSTHLLRILPAGLKGYLEQRTRSWSFKKQWKRVWAELRSGYLVVCKDSDHAVLMKIRLKGSFVEKQTEKDSAGSFRSLIRIKTDSDSFVFRPESESNAEKWYIALSSCASNKVQLSDFEAIANLGRGAHGRVLLVKHLATGKHYALKVTSKAAAQVSATNKRHAIEERAVLELAGSHPFIASLRWAFQSEKNFFMIMDFAQGGEMYHYLDRHGVFSEKQARLIVAELILALDDLHQMGILYRDLKPENVLFGADGHVLLADFGVSKLLPDSGRTDTLCGTRHYLAPEMLRNYGHHGFSVDWWQLGILLYDMLLGESPFWAPSQKEVFENILFAPIIVPESLSKEATDLIVKLLRRDPDYRLGANSVDELKSHPFFKDLNWDRVLRKGYSSPIIVEPFHDGDFRHFDEDFTDHKPDGNLENLSFIQEGQTSKLGHVSGFSFSYPASEASGFRKWEAQPRKMSFRSATMAIMAGLKFGPGKQDGNSDSATSTNARSEIYKEDTPADASTTADQTPGSLSPAKKSPLEVGPRAPDAAAPGSTPDAASPVISQAKPPLLSPQPVAGPTPRSLRSLSLAVMASVRFANAFKPASGSGARPSKLFAGSKQTVNGKFVLHDMKTKFVDPDAMSEISDAASTLSADSDDDDLDELLGHSPTKNSETASDRSVPEMPPSRALRSIDEAVSGSPQREGTSTASRCHEGAAASNATAAPRDSPVLRKRRTSRGKWTLRSAVNAIMAGIYLSGVTADSGESLGNPAAAEASLPQRTQNLSSVAPDALQDEKQEQELSMRVSGDSVALRTSAPPLRVIDPDTGLYCMMDTESEGGDRVRVLASRSPSPSGEADKDSEPKPMARRVEGRSSVPLVRATSAPVVPVQFPEPMPISDRRSSVPGDSGLPPRSGTASSHGSLGSRETSSSVENCGASGMDFHSGTNDDGDVNAASRIVNKVESVADVSPLKAGATGDKGSGSPDGRRRVCSSSGELILSPDQRKKITLRAAALSVMWSLQLNKTGSGVE